MSQPGRVLQWVVWGGLGVTIAAIAAAFVVSRPAGPPPPVLNAVTDFDLIDQHGNRVTLDTLRGEVWVANVIFTRCPLVCGELSRGMSELQESLPPGSPVKLVSLTADPAYDTPEVLEQYAGRFGAREGRWLFLTGERDELYRLAINGLKLAVEEKAEEEVQIPNDLFIHSARFVLVDRQGRVRGWFDGDKPESRQQIPDAVRKLLREKTPS